MNKHSISMLSTHLLVGLFWLCLFKSLGGKQCLPYAQVEYPEIDEEVKPRHRFMSAYEQKKEAWDKAYQYLLFAADPYEVISFKIPNMEVDRSDNFFSHWCATGPAAACLLGLWRAGCCSNLIFSCTAAALPLPQGLLSLSISGCCKQFALFAPQQAANSEDVKSVHRRRPQTNKVSHVAGMQTTRSTRCSCHSRLSSACRRRQLEACQGPPHRQASLLKLANSQYGTLQ